MNLLITDDELVALSSLLGCPTRSPLPTVDASDEPAVADAATRGWRALWVRELVSDEGADADRLVPGLAALRGTVVARTFLTAGSLEPSAAGAMTTVFLTADGEVVLDVTTPAGVHSMAIMSAKDARAQVRAAGVATYKNGVAGDDGGRLSLCIARVGSRPLALTVARGEVRSFTVVEGSVMAESSTTEALGALLDQALPQG